MLSTAELVDAPGRLEELLNRRLALLILLLLLIILISANVEEALRDICSADAFGALENLKSVCLPERFADVLALRIVARIVTVRIGITAKPVEQLQRWCVLRVSMDLIDELAMPDYLGSLLDIEDGRPFHGHEICIRIDADDQFVTHCFRLPDGVVVTRMCQVKAAIDVDALFLLLFEKRLGEFEHLRKLGLI